MSASGGGERGVGAPRATEPGCGAEPHVNASRESLTQESIRLQRAAEWNHLAADDVDVEGERLEARRLQLDVMPAGNQRQRLAQRSEVARGADKRSVDNDIGGVRPDVERDAAVRAPR